MRRLLLALALAAALTVPGPAGAQTAPAPEAALTGVRSLATGVEHTCALLQNTEVRCWGGGSYGKLGNDDFAPQPTPVTVLDTTGTGPLTGVTQYAAGYNHTCALLTNHEVRCWGFNDAGQLATNTGYTSFDRPQIALNSAGTGPLRNVIAIDVGGDTSCALLTNHQLRCWGANGSGQAGVGGTSNPQLPRRVLATSGAGPLTGVTQVSVGGYTTCARLNTGQARCWGYNTKGQVGDGTTGHNRPRPRIVRSISGPGALTGVRQVVAGESVSCALLNTGQLRCWGLNEDGGLGTGGLVDHNRPVRVLASPGHPLTGVARVGAGYSSV